MSVTLYQTSIPVFQKMLGNLKALLPTKRMRARRCV